MVQSNPSWVGREFAASAWGAVSTLQSTWLKAEIRDYMGVSKNRALLVSLSFRHQLSISAPTVSLLHILFGGMPPSICYHRFLSLFNRSPKTKMLPVHDSQLSGSTQKKLVFLVLPPSKRGNIGSLTAISPSLVHIVFEVP